MHAVTNPFNDDYGKIRFICDKCGRLKLVQCPWIISEYGVKK